VHLQPRQPARRTARAALFGVAALVAALLAGPSAAAAADPVAPALTITASRATILWGEGVDITVHLEAPGGSQASVANQTIHVQVARVHTADAFTTIAPGGDIVTDTSGNATIPGYTPATNLWYRAVLDASADLEAATSDDTRVTVRQVALITPDNSGKVRAITKGTTVEFRTKVRPARDDVPRTHVTWQIWRVVNDRWTPYVTQLSDPDVAGNAYLIITFNTGRWFVRSQAMPTQLNANSVWTPGQYYDVK